MHSNLVRQADKLLLSVYNLSRGGSNKKFALEDIAVVAWKDDPSEFCMRGYKEHPDVKRIERIISSLKSRKLITGNANNYSITPKGIDFATAIKSGKNIEKAFKITESAEASRKIRSELERLEQSKMVVDYVSARAKGEKLELLESDFFQFLGTTPRSIYDDKGKTFKERYAIIKDELIPFCKKASKDDKKAALIIDIWNELQTKFGEKITKWLNV